MGIYKELFKNNLITISPESDLNSIVSNGCNGYSYHMDRVEWIIPLNAKVYASISIFLQQLEEKLTSMEWTDDWYQQAKELCRDIALQEALANLNLVMSEHKFDFSPGEKTVYVLSKLLERLSVAQVNNIVWGAVTGAASLYLRGGISKKQAANSVVGGIERKFDRALANGWEIEPYGRNYRLPASVLSEILFNTILKSDDCGFKKPIHELI
jgi:hypothetical protein